MIKQYKPRRNKYGAKPVIIDGIRFASTHEGQTYQKLKLMKKAGAVDDFILQPGYTIELNGQKVCKYVADFGVTFPDGRLEIWDAKGVKTPGYKLKKKLMKAAFNIDIVEV